MQQVRRWLPWIPVAVAAVVLVLHSLRYDFVTDDAYISFVYARNFAEHGELTFNLGDRVEGYTNFLWTVLLGVLMLLGIAPEVSSRVLGTACAIGTLVVAHRMMRRMLPATSSGAIWAGLVPLLLACSSGFACWSSGGLETQLYTLLVAIALDGYVQSFAAGGHGLRRMGIALALASMTRPEGPMIAAILGAHRLAWNVIGEQRWRPSRPELLALAWFALLWAPWFAWRWWYYGWPFPNTYYVKAHGPWASPKLAGEMWHVGLHYLWVWVQQTKLLWALPLALLGLVGSVRDRERWRFGSLVLPLATIYLAYTASVGGDFMGLHRFIMPMFVLAAMAVALGGARLIELLPARRVALDAVVAAALLVGFASSQWHLTTEALRFGNFANDRGIDTPAFLIAYTEDRAAIGRAMAPCFRDDDFSIVGGAGAQPYLARMKAIDVFGLVSSRVAHEEPRIRARAGHTKFASDALLAAYDPTFIFSCYDIQRTDAQPRLGCAAPWLAKGYEEVTLHVPGMRERGEYYTFLARKTRAFTCPGRVH